MKLSRRELLIAGAASMTIRPSGVIDAHPEMQAGPRATAPNPTEHPPNLTIRDYLSREASRITGTAA